MASYRGKSSSFTHPWGGPAGYGRAMINTTEHWTTTRPLARHIVARDWADHVVRAKYGDEAFIGEPGSWTKEVDAVWQGAYDTEYAAMTRELERLAVDMSKPRGK